MKNNKKGFTLIELLAVIAILAILVVLAVPAILDIFNSSKKNAFITQAQTIYKAAEEQIITKQLESPSTSVTMFYSEGTDAQKLDLSGTSTVRYCIKVENNAITQFAVSDGTYSYKNTAISNVSDIEAKSAGSATYTADGKVITGCTAGVATIAAE